jgi:RNA polymerase sigma-70 factor (ECF subfamily)
MRQDTLSLDGPDALARVYERYGDVVYRIAYRLTHSRAEAEDVLQDVFVALPEALGSYAARGSFEGWLRRVAVRATLMRMRRTKRRHEVSLEQVGQGALGSSGAGALVARLTLEQALGRLPEPLRTVFVLKEVEGFDHREIGTMLGISAGASETRLHRARRQLRRWLGGHA